MAALDLGFIKLLNMTDLTETLSLHRWRRRSDEDREMGHDTATEGLQK